MSKPTQSTPDLDEILAEYFTWRGDAIHEINQTANYQRMKTALNKLITSKLEKREQEIADWLEYKLDVFNGACNKCGGKLVEIRPEYPQGQKRTVCPTCLDDIRIGVISNLRPQIASAQLHQGRGSGDE